MNQPEETKTSTAKNSEELIAVIRFILSSVATIAGLFYLGFVLFWGLPQDKRFTQVEAIVFASILILNSDIISRLSKLSISDKGIELLAEQKAREVAKSEVKETKDQVTQVKELLDFIVLFTGIINQYEVNHLNNLKDLTKDAARKYKVTSKVVSQLRKLANFGFIERKEGKYIGPMKDLPEPVDISQNVEITEAGRKYLELLDMKQANKDEQGDVHKEED